MCANYRPARSLQLHFDTQPAAFEYGTDLYPAQFGPILAAGIERPEELVSHRALFGLVPFWAKDLKIARQTYNARSETIAEKPSFRGAWKRRQFCLVPVEAIYEPNYESGKPVRWSIARQDGEPFALAALYEVCPVKEGDGLLRSFSMITINADEHPLMRRFHAPDDEKRSVVVVPPERYRDWLDASSEVEARELLAPFDPGAFTAAPAPRAPRPKAA